VLRWHLLWQQPTGTRMDVQQVVKGIHARIESEQAAASSGGPSAALLSPVEINELAALNVAYGRLYEIRNLVGQTPPAPNTFRARMGGHFIRLAQRMLFWYTPQIRRFQNETASVLGSIRILIERQFETIGELRRDIQSLQRKHALAEQWNRGQHEPAGQQPQRDSPEKDSLPPAFEFALQDHFRGLEGHTAEKLGIWLGTIEGMQTSTGSGTRAAWLDIGCGRGEWLAIAAREDRQITGIDSNPASIEYCRLKGWRADRADAIDYLRSLPDASLAVVTAFHVVEHLPMASLLRLVTEVTRTLQPGGLFAVETPNPRNILMGSHHFWNDPTHQRPIPAALLEFVFNYCGLHTVERLQLNPAPPEERLPYGEIDVIGRMNEHLYGPRDYGIVGRRET
jgi:2-polyprenyl-3-methyl-5-hydroxy-6-metoxy-1,4-benzoquinol methylase